MGMGMGVGEGRRQHDFVHMGRQGHVNRCQAIGVDQFGWHRKHAEAAIRTTTARGGGERVGVAIAGQEGVDADGRERHGKRRGGQGKGMLILLVV